MSGDIEIDIVDKYWLDLLFFNSKYILYIV